MLANADRVVTLLVATPDGLVTRRVWISGLAAVLGAGDGRSDVAAVMPTAEVAAAIERLVGIDRAAREVDDLVGPGQPRATETWETVIDRQLAEDVLSPVAARRRSAVESLSALIARGDGSADGPWRAWCLGATWPEIDGAGDVVVDGEAIVVVEGLDGASFARAWSSWATLRPAGPGEVTSAIRRLTGALEEEPTVPGSRRPVDVCSPAESGRGWSRQSGSAAGAVRPRRAWSAAGAYRKAAGDGTGAIRTAAPGESVSVRSAA